MSIVSAYWPLVLDDLKSKIKPSHYQAWFSNVHFIKIEDGGKKVVLSVQSNLCKEYIEQYFAQTLQNSLRKYYPQVTDIAFKIDRQQLTSLPTRESTNTLLDLDKENNKLDLGKENNKGKSNHKQDSANQQNLSLDIRFRKEDVETNNQLRQEKVLPKDNLTNLNPRYTLDNFIVTNYNEIAFSVAQAVIQSPGQSYNPVFIYSSVGLGKTHLLQAIGNKMLQEYPYFKIRYTTCETFLNHYVHSMQKNRAEEFREYYRNVDLLLVDDIQFIAGKESTQDAFFHTFNELYSQNKQIIIGSDKAPRALDNVEERLVSRFNSGMLVHLSKPDLESRIVITKSKVAETGLNLSEQQILRIAQTVQTNIRDLIGVLYRLEAKTRLSSNFLISDADLDRELEQFVVTNTDSSSYLQNTSTLPELILQQVARVWNLKTEEILGNSRKGNIASARQIIMYLYHEYLHLSLPTIAKMLRRSNHTTILYGVRKIKKLLQSESIVDQKLQEIIRAVNLKV